ncbi:MAG: hypothetical protein CME62_13930 [Halobacteriovoraceae bacterium]|nr:hypothetical protein [Halobacteriovoraceae bacterium]|tara:strand:- start:15678 stop:17012 length:1335 start_codon:yes stop_codon:yes gene_type:complete
MKTPDNSINWSAPVWSENALFLSKKQTRCEEDFSFFNPKLKIFRFIEGEGDYRPFNFADHVTDSNRLASYNSRGPISQTTYNEEYTQIWSYAYSSMLDNYILKAKSPQGLGKYSKQGKDFLICGDDSEFTSTDLENVGLNASLVITKTYQKIKSVSQLDIPQISLSIQPKHIRTKRFRGGEKDKRQEVEYWTNNAFYNPKELKISFLPMAENYKGASLWEVPMVPAHEYGHHIFNLIYYQGKNTNAFFNCFHYAPQTNQLRGQNDLEFTEFAVNAINEGFSDLLAAYTLPDKDSSMKDVGCFEKNREITSDVFLGGDAKIFTSEGQANMLSNFKVKVQDSCAQPDFQYIHHVGAIFAYQVEQIFNRYIQDKKQKLKLLLRFTESLAENRNFLEKQNAVDFLYFSLTLAQATVLNEINRLPQMSDCSAIDQIFEGHRPENGCRFL